MIGFIAFSKKVYNACMQFITHASKDKNKILKKQGNNTEINVFSFLMVFSLRKTVFT